MDISVSVKAVIVRGHSAVVISYDDEASGMHFNFPGGKVRVGESLRSAVHRKAFEETGLSVEAERLLFVMEYVPDLFNDEFGSQQKVQFNFLARLIDPDQEPIVPEPPDENQTGVGWMELSELPKVGLLPRVGPQVNAALRRELTDPLVDRW